MTDLKMFEKNPVTGKKQYIKGSWKKLFRMNGWALLCVLVIVFNFLMYNPVSEECKSAIEDPCQSCRDKLFFVQNLTPQREVPNVDLSPVYDYVTKPRTYNNITLQ